MKQMRILLVTAACIAVLVSSLFLANQAFWQPKIVATAPDFYVGVQFGYDNVTLCKELVDEVKNYTNFFIIGSGLITHNETLLNETCDYICNAGLAFSVYFTPFQIYSQNYTTDPQAMPLNWIPKAQAKYGDKFVGAYVLDEPGGKQIDKNVQRMVTTASDYRLAETLYIETLRDKISDYRNVSDCLFTADYGLYWFDYKAGYDLLLADLGFDSNTQLQIALCRGAAHVHGRDWGTMITWRSSGIPEIETGAALYNDLVLGYESGAKIEVVFDYGEYAWPYHYGILNETHFEALRNFWSYVQQNPDKHGSVKADTALVLPEAYGSGLRSRVDGVWGLFGADFWSAEILSNSESYLQTYGSNLDIVYNDTASNKVTEETYKTLIAWPSPEINILPVRNLNNTLTYATIQEAINTGATSSGDVLLVQPGTYHENVLLNKTISLLGADKATTIIDGGATGSAVNVTRDGVLVSGFTMQNAGGNFGAGIYLGNVSGCTVADNIVVDNEYGLLLNASSGNMLKNNALTGNRYGFGVDGVTLAHFENYIDPTNTVDGKKIYYLLNQQNLGITPLLYPDVGYLALVNCTNITVQDLTVGNNYNGLLLVNTQNSTLLENTLADNFEGIRLVNCSENTLNANHITGGAYNLRVHDAYINTIDTSNTVNDKPVYYLVNKHDQTVPSNAGYVALINCSRITVQNVISTSNWQGILLVSTLNSTIAQNRFTNNAYGIETHNSSGNCFLQNTVSSNAISGITLFDNSTNNTITENSIDTNAQTGIHLYSGCNSNNITQNQFSSNPMGMNINATYNRIETNHVVGSNQGINIDVSSNHTWVIGNVVEDCSYGVNVDSFDHAMGSDGFFGQIYQQLSSSESTYIADNTLRNNNASIRIINSPNNVVTNNTIENSTLGIYLNKVTILSIANNTISKNKITTSQYGISLQSVNNATISQNTVLNCGEGLSISFSQTSIVSDNILANNTFGLMFSSSSYNQLKGNLMTANTYNFYIDPENSDSAFDNSVDSSTNLVDGKLVIYWIGVANQTVPADAGFVVLVNCTGITVQNLTFDGGYSGIILFSTQNSTIKGNLFQNTEEGLCLMGNSTFNKITENQFISNQNALTLQQIYSLGIYQFEQPGSEFRSEFFPQNNTITENTFINNTFIVTLSSKMIDKANPNTLYHNNFINNTYDVGSSLSFASPLFFDMLMIWDNGKEGNYWSNYNGTDLDDDGIGDTTYRVNALIFDSSYIQSFQLFGDNSASQILIGEDHFPLIHPFSSGT